MSSDTDTSAELDRENIIRLLNQLGSDSDEEVMTSARALHAQVKGAGADWDDLLVGEEEEVVEPDQPDVAEEIEEAEENEEEDKKNNGNKNTKKLSDADALKIIDKLLSKEDISEYLKEELEDYKEDISEGEFEASDRSYLIALNKRLS